MGRPAQLVEARRILGMRVDATSYQHATAEILRWGRRGESRYVCVATVNNVVEAYDDPAYHQVMEDADLVTPDGVPLVWALRLLGVDGASRVYGPDLTPLLCERAAALGVPVGFYGSTPEVLEDLTANLVRRYPALHVAYSYSPPFRPLTQDEDRRVAESINRSGAQLLFVGLGAPKQEQWMAAHRGAVRVVMLGVGAAFDFLAGRKRQAPAILQRLGLEWLFRLLNEPRRLWRRYLYRNPRFLALFAMQLLHGRSRHGASSCQRPPGGEAKVLHRRRRARRRSGPPGPPAVGGDAARQRHLFGHVLQRLLSSGERIRAARADRRGAA